MSRSSYYNKFYRHPTTHRDFTGIEDHDEERQDIYPHPAHAPSISASMTSSSPPPRRSFLTLPSDISLLPVGVNYSTTDCTKDSKNALRCQRDDNILEVPKPQLSNDRSKSYPNLILRNRHHKISSNRDSSQIDNPVSPYHIQVDFWSCFNEYSEFTWLIKNNTFHLLPDSSL